MNRKLICQILNHEMMLATGCTEPAAIALTAAIAREQLDGELEHIKVRASANIIKNAMSAGIPGTNYTGINYAAALGAVCGAVTASSGLWMTPARKTLKERPILWKMDMWT
mgnify:CR=1 FL=1